MSKSKMITANENYHDYVAETYDQSQPFIKNGFAQKMFLEDIDEIIDWIGRPPRELRVLDCGSGTGNLSLKFLERNCSVVAVDVSAQMLAVLQQQAEQRSLRGLRIVHSDVDSFLGSIDEKYDVVCSSSFLHHLPDYRLTYRSMLSRCNPHGVVYTAFEPKAGGGLTWAARVLGKVDSLLQKVRGRKLYRPDILIVKVLRRIGVASRPEMPPENSIDHDLIERPDLGVDLEELKKALEEAGFDKSRAIWRSVKRFWFTYQLDRWLVKSHNALFLLAQNRSAQLG